LADTLRAKLFTEPSSIALAGSGQPAITEAYDLFLKGRIPGTPRLRVQKTRNCSIAPETFYRQGRLARDPNFPPLLCAARLQPSISGIGLAIG